MKAQYDYIVVGAGSAGCVIANRLSARADVSVLLLESGPGDESALVKMPRGIGGLLKPGNPRVFAYEAKQSVGGATEQWLKGRTIGGSSSVNGMVYIRGAARDYDAWEAAGCTGWGWDEMLRRFVELEDHELGASAERGSGGPLKVTVPQFGDAMSEALIAGAEELGVSRVADINSEQAVAHGGFGYQPVNIWNGRRFSAADAFLKPVIGRANLSVETGAHVTRILFDGKRAVGVRLRELNGEHDVLAAREVILCAGAIESPRLLQLSGIGPREVLDDAGVQVLVDAPEVGSNLIEHRYMAVQYRSHGPSQNEHLRGIGLLASALKYIFSKKGPLTHGAFEGGGFVKTDPSLAHPDAQIGVWLFSMADAARAGAEAGHVKSPAVDRTPGVAVGGYFTQPRSRGHMRILSSDPDVAPYIDANYFSDEEDVRRSVAMVRWIRQLMQTKVVRPLVVEECVPGAHCQTDAEIRQAILTYGTTGYHVAGTCRMGADARSVVDARLRVRGVTNLRVMDTSVMPTLVSGNTNAPTQAMALRAAALILEDAVQEQELRAVPAPV